MDEKNKKDTSILRKAWNAARGYLYIPVVVLVFVLLFGVVLVYGPVPSGSMEPTCEAGSLYIGSRLAYQLGDVERGDIVLAEHEGTVYLKRVVGLPGEAVSFANGDVYIDGTLLDESAYLSSDVQTTAPCPAYDVPDGCYFLMGDNRTNSNDARYWAGAYVPADDLVGKYWASIPVPFLFSKGG